MIPNYQSTSPPCTPVKKSNENEYVSITRPFPHRPTQLPSRTTPPDVGRSYATLALGRENNGTLFGQRNGHPVIHFNLGNLLRQSVGGSQFTDDIGHGQKSYKPHPRPVDQTRRRPPRRLHRRLRSQRKTPPPPRKGDGKFRQSRGRNDAPPKGERRVLK